MSLLHQARVRLHEPRHVRDVLRHVRRDLLPLPVPPARARQLSALHAGLKLLLWTGSVMVVSPIAGVLSSRFGSRPFLVAGLVLQAAALTWIAATASTTTSYTTVIVPFIFGGSGMALVFAPSASAILASVRDDQAGQASGAANAIREVGGVFGVASSHDLRRRRQLRHRPRVRHRPDPGAVGRRRRARRGRAADRGGAVVAGDGAGRDGRAGGRARTLTYGGRADSASQPGLRRRRVRSRVRRVGTARVGARRSLQSGAAGRRTRRRRAPASASRAPCPAAASPRTRRRTSPRSARSGCPRGRGSSCCARGAPGRTRPRRSCACRRPPRSARSPPPRPRP